MAVDRLHKLNSILTYTSRIGKSIAYSSLDAIKEQMPFTTSLVEDNKETVKQFYKDIVGSKQQLSKFSNLQDNYIFKPSKELLKNLKEDLKSGNFYNKERQEAAAQASESDMLKELLGAEGLGDLADFLNGEEEVKEEDLEDMVVKPQQTISTGEAVIASITARESRLATNTLLKAQTSLVDAQMKTARGIANLQLKQSQRTANLMQQGFSQMTKGFNAIFDFQNNVMLQHAKNAQKYFENMTELTQENNAILKEIVEMQRNLYKDYVDREEKSSNNPFQDGRFNLKSYIDIVKNNIGLMDDNNYLNLFSSLLKGQIKEITSNPIGTLMTTIISSMMGNSMRTSMKKFDSNLRSTMQSALVRLGRAGADKNSGFLTKIFGQIFGINDKPISVRSIDLAKGMHGPRPFDAEDHFFITKVFPSYLSRIEAALTNSPERVFDSRVGKFVTASSINKIMKNEETKKAKSELNEVIDEIRKNLFQTMKVDPNDRKTLRRIEKALTDFANGVHENGGFGSNGFADIKFNKNNKYGEAAQYIYTMLTNGFISRESLQSAESQILNNRIEQRNNRTTAQDLSFEEIFQAMNADRTFNESKIMNSARRVNNLTEKAQYNLLEWQAKIHDTLIEIRDKIPEVTVIPQTPSNTPPGGSGGWNRRRQINKITRRNKKTSQTTQPTQQEQQNEIKFNTDPLKGVYEKDGCLWYADGNLLRDTNGIFYDHSGDIIKNSSYEAVFRAAEGNILGTSSGLTANDIFDDNKKSNQYIQHLQNISEKSKEYQSKTELYSNKQILDAVFSSGDNGLDYINANLGKLNVNPNDDLLKQLAQAATIGDKMGVIANNINKIVTAPRTILTSVLTQADKLMYDLLFTRNTGEVDEEGRSINGIFDYMLNSIDSINKSAENWIEKLNDEHANPLDVITNWVEKTFDININQRIESYKNTATKYGNIVKDQFINSGKSIFDEVKDAVKGTWADIGNAFNSRAYGSPMTGENERSLSFISRGEAIIPGEGSSSKGTNMVQRGGLTTLGKGDIVIPSTMNPWNPNRKNASIEKDAENENRMRDRLADSIKSIPGYFLGRNTLSADELKQINEAIINLRNNPNDEEAYFTLQSFWRDELFRNNKATFKKVKQIIDQIGLGEMFPDENTIREEELENGSGIVNGTKQFLFKTFGSDPGEAVSKLGKLVTKNIGSTVSNSMKGAIAGTILPLGGPFLGALAGASLNLLSKNDSFMNYVFGTKIAEGERKDDGLIPTEYMKSLERYIPDMKKYGITGSLIGLVTPFGPLGGLIAGFAASYIKNNEKMYNFIFGNERDSKSGLFSKDNRAAIKRALPSIGASMLGTFFLGPFGLLGNAALGAGIGLLTTTESFKSTMLGSKDRDGKRHGGLAGAIRRHIIIPLKDSMEEIKTGVKEWFREDVLKPLGTGIKPIMESSFDLVKDSISNLFDTLRGSGEASGFFEKAFDKIKYIRDAGGVGKAVGKWVGGKIGGLAHGIENIGNKVQRNRLNEGRLRHFSAQERIEEAKRLKEAGILGAEDDYKFSEFDKRLVGMNESDIEGNLKDLKDYMAFYSKDNGRAIEGIGNEKLRHMMSDIGKFTEESRNGAKVHDKLIGIAEDIKRIKNPIELNKIMKNNSALDELLNDENNKFTEEEKETIKSIFTQGTNELTRYLTLKNMYENPDQNKEDIERLNSIRTTLAGDTISEEEFKKRLPQIVKMLENEGSNRERYNREQGIEEEVPQEENKEKFDAKTNDENALEAVKESSEQTSMNTTKMIELMNGTDSEFFDRLNQIINGDGNLTSVQKSMVNTDAQIKYMTQRFKDRQQNRNFEKDKIDTNVTDTNTPDDIRVNTKQRWFKKKITKVAKFAGNTALYLGNKAADVTAAGIDVINGNDEAKRDLRDTRINASWSEEMYDNLTDAVNEVTKDWSAERLKAKGKILAYITTHFQKIGNDITQNSQAKLPLYAKLANDIREGKRDVTKIPDYLDAILSNKSLDSVDIQDSINKIQSNAGGKGFMSLLSKAGSKAKNFLGSFFSGDDDKEETKDEPKKSTGSSLGFDFAAALGGAFASRPTNVAAAASTSTMNVPSEDGSVVVMTPYGPKRYTKSSTDGQLMEANDKNNQETNEKEQAAMSLQERTTSALEKIAENYGGDSGKGGAKKKGGGLLASLMAFLTPFSGILTSALGKLKDFGKWMFKGITKWGGKLLRGLGGLLMKIPGVGAAVGLAKTGLDKAKDFLGFGGRETDVIDTENPSKKRDIKRGSDRNLRNRGTNRYRARRATNGLKGAAEGAEKKLAEEAANSGLISNFKSFFTKFWETLVSTVKKFTNSESILKFLKGFKTKILNLLKNPKAVVRLGKALVKHGTKLSIGAATAGLGLLAIDAPFMAIGFAWGWHNSEEMLGIPEGTADTSMNAICGIAHAIAENTIVSLLSLLFSDSDKPTEQAILDYMLNTDIIGLIIDKDKLEELRKKHKSGKEDEDDIESDENTFSDNDIETYQREIDNQNKQNQRKMEGKGSRDSYINESYNTSKVSSSNNNNAKGKSYIYSTNNKNAKSKYGRSSKFVRKIGRSPIYESQLDPQNAMRMQVPGDTEYMDMANRGCGEIATVNAIHAQGNMSVTGKDAGRFALHGKGNHPWLRAGRGRFGRNRYLAPDDGTDPQFIHDYAQTNGMSTSDLSNKEEFDSYLDNGGSVVVGGTDPSRNTRPINGGETLFTENPHYSTVTGRYTDKNGRAHLMISDPQGNTPEPKDYFEDDIINNIDDAVGVKGRSKRRFGRRSRFGRASLADFRQVNDNSSSGDFLNPEQIALEISKNTSLPPELIYAQMAHETGNFESELTKEHNYGGVKDAVGEDKTGSRTSESGYTWTVTGFDNRGHSYFNNDRSFVNYMSYYYPLYKDDGMGIFNVKTPADWASVLKAGGYYTDSEENYRRNIEGIINSNPDVMQRLRENHPSNANPISNSPGSTSTNTGSNGSKGFTGIGVIDDALKNALANSPIGQFLVSNSPFFASIMGGGSSGGAGASGSFQSSSSDAGIKAASAWAQSMVGKEGYGNNGCTEFVKNYLLKANNPIGEYMKDCSPIANEVQAAAQKAQSELNESPNPTLMWVPTLEMWAKMKNYWKQPGQGGAEGDICIVNDHGHVLIADGKGGAWGNSSGQNKILHYDSIAEYYDSIQGYVATGSGNATVSNGQVKRSREEMIADGGSTNVGFGKGKPVNTKKDISKGNAKSGIAKKKGKSKIRRIGRSKFGRGRFGRDKSTDSDAPRIWQFLTQDKKLSNVSAAGIMGNLMAESSLYSDRIEGTSPDEGSDTMNIDGETGYGLAQWTSQGRQEKLHNYLSYKGLPDSDWKGQLSFMTDGEDEDIAPVVKEMDTLNDPYKAALYFHKEYERSADTEEMAARRGEYAKNFFTDIGHGQYNGSSNLSPNSSGGKSSLHGQKGFSGIAVLDDALTYVLENTEMGKFLVNNSPFFAALVKKNGNNGGKAGSNGASNPNAKRVTAPQTGSAAEALLKMIKGAEITSPYGPRGSTGTFHAGIDLGLDDGTEIPTPVDGEVDDVGEDPQGYGNYVVIKDPKGNYHIFAHLSEQLVKTGEKVVAGQVIAKSGHSGHCIPDGPDGAHLHYGIYDSSNPNCAGSEGSLNPEEFQIAGLASTEGREQGKVEEAGSVADFKRQQEQQEQEMTRRRGINDEIQKINHATQSGISATTNSEEALKQRVAARYGAYTNGQGKFGRGKFGKGSLVSYIRPTGVNNATDEGSIEDILGTQHRTKEQIRREQIAQRNVSAKYESMIDKMDLKQLQESFKDIDVSGIPKSSIPDFNQDTLPIIKSKLKDIMKTKNGKGKFGRAKNTTNEDIDQMQRKDILKLFKKYDLKSIPEGNLPSEDDDLNTLREKAKFLIKNGKKKHKNIFTSLFGAIDNGFSAMDNFFGGIFGYRKPKETKDKYFITESGIKIEQNDIDYLISQGYTKEDAIAFLLTDPKYADQVKKAGPNSPINAPVTSTSSDNASVSSSSSYEDEEEDDEEYEDDEISGADEYRREQLEEEEYSQRSQELNNRRRINDEFNNINNSTQTGISATTNSEEALMQRIKTRYGGYYGKGKGRNKSIKRSIDKVRKLNSFTNGGSKIDAILDDDNLLINKPNENNIPDYTNDSLTVLRAKEQALAKTQQSAANQSTAGINQAKVSTASSAVPATNNKLDRLIAIQTETNKLLSSILQAIVDNGNAIAAISGEENNTYSTARDARSVLRGSGSIYGMGPNYMTTQMNRGKSYNSILESLSAVSTM